MSSIRAPKTLKLLPCKLAIKLIKETHFKNAKINSNILHPIFDIYKRTETHKNHALINLMLKICSSSASSADICFIWRDVESMTNKNLIQLPLLFNCLMECDNVQTDKCVTIIQWMHECNYNHMHRIAPNQVIQLLASCTCAQQLQTIQSFIASRATLKQNNYINTALINAYSRFGEIQHATLLFNSIPTNDINVICVGTMMKALMHNNQSEQALRLFQQFHSMRNHVLESLAIKACIHTNDFKTGKQIHAVMDENNADLSVKTSLMEFYGHFSDVKAALQVFHSISTCTINSIVVGAIMKVLIQNQQSKKAIQLYTQYSNLHNAIIHNLALMACMELNDFVNGRNIHQILDTNDTYTHNIQLQCTLIDFYGHFADIDAAQNIFDNIDSKHITPVCVGSMMKAYIDNQHHDKAVSLYHRTNREQTNDICDMLAIKAYMSAKQYESCAKFVESLHINENTDNQLKNTMIKFYGEISDVINAENVFASVMKLNVFSYSVMMTVYVNNDEDEKALQLYDTLAANDHNDITHLLGIKACIHTNNCAKGKRIYDDVSANEMTNALKHTLISFFGHFGEMDAAINVFISIKDKQKEVVSFNCLMEAYSNNHKHWECSQLFESLKNEYTHLKPDCISYAIMLKVCTQQPFIEMGQKIHKRLERNENRWMLDETSIQINLIQMYAVFGMLEGCEKVFTDVERNQFEKYCNELSIWNAMINACGKNGDGQKALQMLDRMQDIKLMPTKTTYITVINALSHCGMTQDASAIWKNTIKDDSIKYDEVLVTTLVDCMARNGKLSFANELILEYERFQMQ